MVHEGILSAVANERGLNEKAVSSWMDIIPAYVAFVLRFFKDPKGAFARVSKQGEVSSDLTAILLGGIGLAYLIAIAAIRDSKSRLEAFGVDERVLPAAAATLILFAAVLTHLLMFAAARWAGEYELDGTVEDTVNAGAGFAAICVPFATIVVCVALSRGFDPTHWLVWTPVALFFLGAFPAALMGAHPNTSYTRASSAVFIALAALWSASYYL
jgi:hypothetical protein